MPTLEDTIFLAALAHKGKKDRGGQPYILHPLRVMLSMDSEEERLVALLHDIVQDSEDSGITLQWLEDYGYSPGILKALNHLTRKPSEEYSDYIERVAKNPLAMRVKLANIRENLNKIRLCDPTAENGYAGEFKRSFREDVFLKTFS